MAEITYFVVVPFQGTESGLVAEQGIQCPSERSAIAQACGAVSKGAVGAIAFKRSGDPNIGEYGEAVLICKEGDLPDSVLEMLAAEKENAPFEARVSAAVLIGSCDGALAMLVAVDRFRYPLLPQAVHAASIQLRSCVRADPCLPENRVRASAQPQQPRRYGDCDPLDHLVTWR